ncbi:AlpA family phage regulatory protein [Vibrio cholerae]|uniref:helix-turn-helix transcriptional regulator n=1 Tax=Gammaproteobacteria TaxID=1236 RepID=UPI0011DA2B3E|nr:MULTISPECIES: AlpA family phage regulatory protein [Gammaproteobacteria]EDW6137574.1 AlpA family phage regulatory protein [Salmonella enterica subsp. enterica]EHG8656504.1 AlpA family phage regulatory protein [Salmonella enterica subsp. enterica serovar Montevideo]EHP9281732.1 AlpA family phage regulatory protein [Salmonella enterica subsp. enterica serovar Infantis]EKO3537239.1 AlpA family phage regulatory protein [Vibrio fluvialis]EGR0683008.1 AlpA family phage regulatory protein [Vibrio 
MRQASRYSPPPTEIRGEILRAYNESERLIKEAERERITAISRTTWWRLERSGEVPRRKRVGGSTVWLLSDLLAWMQK